MRATPARSPRCSSPRAFLTRQRPRSRAQNEGAVFDTRLLDSRNAVLVLTLREPVSRILSSYHYDSTRGGAAAANHSLSLGAWIAEIQRRNQPNPHRTLRRLWTEVQNFYTQLISGNVTGGPVSDTQLTRAMQVLSSFDVVLITERLTEKRVQAFAAATLGLPARRAFPHKNANTRQVRRRQRLPPSGEDEEAMAWLRRLNDEDLRLYEYADSLLTHRIDRLESPAPADHCAAADCPTVAETTPLGEAGERLERRCAHLGRAFRRPGTSSLSGDVAVLSIEERFALLLNSKSTAGS